MPRPLACYCLVLIPTLIAASSNSAWAQATPVTGNAPGATAEVKGPLPVAGQGEQVLVKREAAKLIDPEKYRVHLSLAPYHQVLLSAPCDGVVKQIAAKPNAQVRAQGELLRLDNTIQKLALAKSQAEFKAATIEQKLADKKDENVAALAAAKLEASKAELDLAQHFYDQTTVRTPINGEVLRILVVEGEYVRTGQPLIEVGDAARLKVEIPVDRHAVENGKNFPIKVEANDVDGKVDAVLPLGTVFNPLRDLFESIASATIVLENPDGKYKMGQTVYVPLIPRHPVVEVPSSAVANNPDGTRRVQVLRQWVVRDLPVVLMGAIGSSRLYVAGPFAAGDEVIYEGSHQLPDGYQLKAFAGTGTAAPGTTPAATPGVTRPSGTGF
ncbi:MAG: HlyD family efflux transporter periplasmic adaptor subunit [Planctomycetaceae bacterium]|nr:HlyD family efflux transporter periplasmic adaptor subunit [Planctomycetaceae bacterium]